MKFFHIALLFVIFTLTYQLSFSVAEDVNVNKRIAALRRPPVGKAAKQPTTTTTTEAPADDEEGDYVDNKEYADEAEEVSSTTTTTTTTETPKRVGPVIRPLRSNDDFLNSLKRRRMNVKKSNSEKPAPKLSKPVDSQEEGEESAPVAAPAPSKGFNKSSSSLNRRKLNKPSKPEAGNDAAAEESEQEQKEDTKPKRPLGRLALRKRN